MKRTEGESGEMAQQLRALTALPEVLSSNLRNHMVALLVCLKTATVYLYIRKKERIKKKKERKEGMFHSCILDADGSHCSKV